MIPGAEDVAIRLTHLWMTWNPEQGSLVDRIGIDEAVELFEAIGPFTVYVHSDPDNCRSEVRAISREHPDSVPTLMRGAREGDRDGMAWTESLGTACNFAWQADGHVYECEFETGDVLARIHQTFEAQPDEEPETEWIMRPNGQARLWQLPWLDNAADDVIKAEQTRLVHQAVELTGDKYGDMFREGRRNTLTKKAEQYGADFATESIIPDNK